MYALFYGAIAPFLEDKVYRSFGILTNARKLTSEETDNLLSDIKLGTDLGIIESSSI